MVITPSPRHVAISVGQRAGAAKDTLRNIQETGDFVINIVSSDIVQRMNVAAGDWPYGVSEFGESGLSPKPGERVRPPLVAEAPASLECMLRQVLPVGGPPYCAQLVIGEVVRFHVRDDLVLERDRIDIKRLQAVGRMAGDGYCSTQEQFELRRPLIGETRSIGSS